MKRQKICSVNSGNEKRVIIITGTPGTGKSSVSRMLASNINARLIILGDIVKKEDLFVARDEKSNSLIIEIGKLSERIKKIILHTQRDLVIDGHYAVDVVPPSCVIKVFVLRRHPEELEGVLTKRGYSKEKIKENLAAEILDVCLYDAVVKYGVKRVCEINVTKKNIEETIREIFYIVEGRDKCKIRIVDWLGMLYIEGSLDRYIGDF